MITLIEEKRISNSKIEIKFSVINIVHHNEEFVVTLTKKYNEVYHSLSSIPRLDQDDTECLSYLIGKNARELLGEPLRFN